MKTYSLDLRQRIVAARQEGEPVTELARRFQVSKRTVERYWRRYQETGKLEGLQRGGYRRAILEGHDSALRQWIRQQPSITLEEMLELCQNQLKVRLKKSALSNRLAKLGLSFKKNDARRRARSARP
jgi:transposase